MYFFRKLNVMIFFFNNLLAFYCCPKVCEHLPISNNSASSRPAAFKKNISPLTQLLIWISSTCVSSLKTPVHHTVGPTPITTRGVQRHQRPNWRPPPGWRGPQLSLVEGPRADQEDYPYWWWKPPARRGFSVQGTGRLHCVKEKMDGASYFRISSNRLLASVRALESRG